MILQFHHRTTGSAITLCCEFSVFALSGSNRPVLIEYKSVWKINILVAELIMASGFISKNKMFFVKWKHDVLRLSYLKKKDKKRTKIGHTKWGKVLCPRDIFWSLRCSTEHKENVVFHKAAVIYGESVPNPMHLPYASLPAFLCIRF